MGSLGSNVVELALSISGCSSTGGRFVVEETDQVYVFPEGSIKLGKDNVITIVQVSASTSYSSYLIGPNIVIEG